MAKRRRDYYEILGISKDADEADLKRAYRELARRCHPDVNPDDPGATERFREINEAYAALSDPRERARYDRMGAPGDDGGSGLGAVAQAVEDVIGDVLRRRRSKQRGRDLRYTLEIGFEEAAFGCTKTIRVPTGEAGAGAAAAPAREFSVVVAPGTRDSAIKTLRGEGEPGRGGGGPGDLHVLLRVREHAVLRRDGDDVWSDLTISFPQAALGAVVDVPTLDGPIKMRIPDGAASGRVFRIRGRGVPRAAGKNAPRGDHLVKVTVAVPTELTARQRAAVEELARALEDGRHSPATTTPAGGKRGLIDRVRSLLDE
ncbi:MAG: J domain-containing protein [Kofleriaceae bacterium]|jgi:molecular chaperone DnaJ|nr:J domain-containing protein [Kofleriaceae bacterium]MBP6838643.1 J domain-containing protein [Kofleriaceae bacterium]MBP9207747.1 J domain-containing protein [Kofleriaceae bacterium]